MSYVKLGKKLINSLILKHFPKREKGRKPKIALWRIIEMILYRLKTGCQWRELPVKLFCRKKLITWQTAYYHFKKWSETGIWKKVWTSLLFANKADKDKIDLSNVQLDGSQTPAKRGGEAVGYQGRKKTKTTNCLFFTDANGQILAMSEPVSGNHNDLYDIEKTADKIFKDLQAAGFEIKGLFLNADAGFDSASFRTFCEIKDIVPNFDIKKQNLQNDDYPYFKDEKLYKNRFVIERFNAWMDSFKAIATRYERLKSTWISLHYIAFIFWFLKTHF